MKRGIIAGLLLFARAHLLADDYSELFRKAAAYTQQGKYEQAVAEYKAALAVRPTMSSENIRTHSISLRKSGRITLS